MDTLRESPCGHRRTIWKSLDVREGPGKGPTEAVCVSVRMESLRVASS